MKYKCCSGIKGDEHLNNYLVKDVDEVIANADLASEIVEIQRN